MPLADFNRHAKDYEKEAALQTKYGKVLIDDIFKLRGDEFLKIADLGCGTGNLSQEISARRQNYQINNFDQSEAMLELAKNKLSKISNNFILGSIPSDNDYDLILSNFALQWYENLDNTLEILKSKLNKNGLLGIILPVEGSFPELAEIFKINKQEHNFFNFPLHEKILKIFEKNEIQCNQLFEDKQIFSDTLLFLRHLHQIGANQTNKKISPAILIKIIDQHDALFHDKIIVRYKILKLIIKKI